MMRIVLVAVAIALASSSAALAFDADTQAVIDRQKISKRVSITDMATLMRSSEKWCYDNQEHSCAWTDVYVEVTEEGAAFEIANAWDADTDIAFIDTGTFMDGRYICETGEDWVPTVRATRRDGNGPLDGRLLWDLKKEISAAIAADEPACYDYLYMRSDADYLQVWLLQRQYVDGVHDAANDVAVTVHFNAQDAAGLTLRE